MESQIGINDQIGLDEMNYVLIVFTSSNKGQCTALD